MVNGEKKVKLNSVIVHETATGYAQGFEEDAYSKLMGNIDLNKIIFSDAVRADWKEAALWKKIIKGETFINPETI